ncbi:MAG: hypothetical protein LBM59_00870 [Ruminococcus sp.]|jgi:hypothetical protein|nr:hypothetical protein [Ruminococcus sp.]
MNTHKILVKSANIPEERIRELAAAPFPKKPPTDEARKVYVKAALKQFLLSILIAAGGAAVYLLSARRRFLAILILVVAVIIFIVAISHFLKLFKDIRETNPKAVLRQFLHTILLGYDSDIFGKKSVSYAYSELLRLIPDAVLCKKVDFERYLTNFREYIRRKHNESYDDVFLKDFNEKREAVPIIKNVSFSEQGGGIYNAVFTVEYIEQGKQESGKLSSSKPKAKDYARFEVTFEVLLIKSGQFYFFADPMPEISFID